MASKLPSLTKAIFGVSKKTPGARPITFGRNTIYVVPKSSKNSNKAPAAPPPPPAPAKPAAAPFAPAPLAADEASGAFNYPSFNINMPAAPPPQYAPGGAGAVVDGNATGFKRKKSSARMAGLTSKGTSQFKISGQSAKSSGLNIGI